MKTFLSIWLVVAFAGLPFSPPAFANDPDPAQKSMSLLRKTTLALLQEGNERFVSGSLKHPNTDAAHRLATAIDGQEPFVTVLACSDSRVPVELIFDRGVGEIFTIRVAGNVADTDEIATIEYGVGHLNTPLVVVMGHTRCGAVTAVVKGVELDGLLPQLVDNIKPAADRARHEGGEESVIIANAIKANVWQSISDLLRRSTVVRKELEAGSVSVVGAIYNLETGTVEWLGEHPDQKNILSAYKTESKPVASAPGGRPVKGPAAPLTDPNELPAKPANQPAPPAHPDYSAVAAHNESGGHESHGH